MDCSNSVSKRARFSPTRGSLGFILDQYGSKRTVFTRARWRLADPRFCWRTCAFPLSVGSRDAALLVKLPPGGYTAQVTGADGGGGVALVEVYEVTQ